MENFIEESKANDENLDDVKTWESISKILNEEGPPTKSLTEWINVKIHFIVLKPI